MYRINNTISRVMVKAGWLLEAALWPLVRPLFLQQNKTGEGPGLVIGITTFKDRFSNSLKPLLKKLAILFPDVRIVVVANGDINDQAQERYLKEMEKFTGRFSNVTLIPFRRPVGLSFLWNSIIEEGGSPATLILNDDLKLKSSFRRFILESGITGCAIATINSSWSHFIITSQIVEKVGWFDERFTEVGGEDDDYLARLAEQGVKAADFHTGSVTRSNPHRRKPLKVNSYGKDMSKERGGYSTANTLYLQSKWHISNSPVDGGVLVPQRNGTYWKRNPGYENIKTRGQDC